MRANWKSVSHLFLTLSTIALTQSCTQVDVSGLNPDLFTNQGNGGGNNSALCEGVNSKFSTDVLPIFNSKCNNVGCHIGAGSGGGLNLSSTDNYLGDGESGVIGNIKSSSEISLTTPSQSQLLLKPLASAEGGGSGSHGGGEIFNSTNDADYKTILCWIDSGAVNDLDSSLCTFGEHVYPIFSPKTPGPGRGCAANTPCHGSAPYGGNMNLSQDSISLVTDTGSQSFDDATAQTVVVPGDSSTSLLLKYPSGQVSHTGGAIFKTTTDEDYQTIKCWIDEGAKNN